jgi:SPP1 family predicted phage head-tail adaptor
MPQAGAYDRLVTLQAAVLKRGSAGGATNQWEEFATVWARKEDVSGGETRRGNQVVAETSAVFELRHYIDGLTTKHRLVNDDGKAFDILFIREIGRDSMELQCRMREEGTA